MAKPPKLPVTSAIRFLRAADATFEPAQYVYVERGGTAASSAALGVPEHQVIKTLIMQTEKKTPLIVLMHGDNSVATGSLARAIGTKKVTPCSPELAQKFSGYRVGGTSPFGTRKAMPVYAETSIRTLELLCINAGKRGFLVKLSGAELERVLHPIWVSVAA